VEKFEYTGATRESASTEPGDSARLGLGLTLRGRVPVVLFDRQLDLEVALTCKEGVSVSRRRTELLAARRQLSHHSGKLGIGGVWLESPLEDVRHGYDHAAAALTVSCDPD